MGAAAFALKVMGYVPMIMQGVEGAIDAFNAGKTVVEGLVRDNRDPTPEEWDKENAVTADLRAKLHDKSGDI